MPAHLGIPKLQEGGPGKDFRVDDRGPAPCFWGASATETDQGTELSPLGGTPVGNRHGGGGFPLQGLYQLPRTLLSTPLHPWLASLRDIVLGYGLWKATGALSVWLCPAADVTVSGGVCGCVSGACVHRLRGAGRIRHVQRSCGHSTLMARCCSGLKLPLSWPRREHTRSLCPMCTRATAGTRP